MRLVCACYEWNGRGLRKGFTLGMNRGNGTKASLHETDVTGVVFFFLRSLFWSGSC
jgi:hypothetical protein